MANTVAVTRASRYGDFRPLKLRASGGFSDVYVAKHKNGRLAALKVFRDTGSNSDRSLGRFQREREILERIDSRRVSRFIDADLESEPPWIASELIEGPTLREVVEKGGPLPVCTAITIVALLAETLSELHDLGVAHRDISPNNIILGNQGPTLIDFGSAKSDSFSGSVSRLSVATPGFASPEVLSGEMATNASDVYGLGRLASFLMTGDSSTGTSHLGGLQTTQQDLISRCIDEDPNQRPDAREVFESLKDSIDLVALDSVEKITPELKSVPRGLTFRAFVGSSLLLLVFAVAVTFQVTKEPPPATTKSLVDQLSAQNMNAIKTKTFVGNFGVFNKITLPENTEIFRDRLNKNKLPISPALDLYEINDDESDFYATLQVSVLPEVSEERFEQISTRDSPVDIDELSYFGVLVRRGVEAQQYHAVYTDCPLMSPEETQVDAVAGKIRYVSISPICEEIVGSTEIAFVIFDWFPKKNLLLSLTGTVDILELNPTVVMDSIQIRADLPELVHQLDSPVGLSEISLYKDAESLVDDPSSDYPFFYANVFLEIPPRKGLKMKLEADPNSLSQLTFHAYEFDRETSDYSEKPAGRIWAIDTHEIQLDNPQATPLMISIEIDNDDVEPLKATFEAASVIEPNKWLTGVDFGLGLDSGDGDSEVTVQLLLPHSLEESMTDRTLSIGGFSFLAPSNWLVATNDLLGKAGLIELWQGGDSTTRSWEDDLPHLRVMTEEFGLQVDGVDGGYWQTTSSSLCEAQQTFSLRSKQEISWTVFLDCGVRDAYQDGSYRFLQSQGAPIIKFTVNSVVSGSDDVEVLLKGQFVPGTQEDLDYLRRLFIFFSEQDTIGAKWNQLESDS